MVRLAMLFTLLLLTVFPTAQAQTRDCLRTIQGDTVCPPPKTQCVQERDNLGIRCSPPDGGIMLDRYGKAVCGAGSCVINLNGEAFCSRSAGGAAAINIQSEPVCTNGCEKASAAMCSVLSR